MFSAITEGIKKMLIVLVTLDPSTLVVKVAQDNGSCTQPSQTQYKQKNISLHKVATASFISILKKNKLSMYLSYVLQFICAWAFLIFNGPAKLQTKFHYTVQYS